MIVVLRAERAPPTIVADFEHARIITKNTPCPYLVVGISLQDELDKLYMSNTIDYIFP